METIVLISHYFKIISTYRFYKLIYKYEFLFRLLNTMINTNVSFSRPNLQYLPLEADTANY